jgi:hypothetical protein
VYFAFEDDDIDAVLADVKRNDAIGQPATATTGGYSCYLFLNISQLLVPLGFTFPEYVFLFFFLFFLFFFFFIYLSEKYVQLISSISSVKI